MPSLAAVAGLALIHVLIKRLELVRRIPRSEWLSLAGGMSVAYVIVHLLPELSSGQAAVTGAMPGWLGALERHVYVTTLVGLAAFYGLERLAKVSQRRTEPAVRGRLPEPAVFALHIASFGLYNLLIGYLIRHLEQPSATSQFLSVLAMAGHFLVTDIALYNQHPEPYQRTGCWLLAGAVSLGWLLGVLVALPKAFTALAVAFLAGGVILNVHKE